MRSTFDTSRRPRGDSRDGTAAVALSLLEKWTPSTPDRPGLSTPQAVAYWQQWYARQFPQGPPLTPTDGSRAPTHSLASLMQYLQNAKTTPEVVQRGAVVFEKAQCAKCHRFGAGGETMGPDLTQVSKRFSTQEILESPSRNPRV